jgi:hypothetical protein
MRNAILTLIFLAVVCLTLTVYVATGDIISAIKDNPVQVARSITYDVAVNPGGNITIEETK